MHESMSLPMTSWADSSLTKKRSYIMVLELSIVFLRVGVVLLGAHRVERLLIRKHRANGDATCIEHHVLTLLGGDVFWHDDDGRFDVDDLSMVL